jgi:hypothetical protein
MSSSMQPEIMDAAGAMASGGTMLQTRGTYNTAVSVLKPRSLADVQRRLLEEAALMGDQGFYGWGAGKDAIEGPGEALAYAAARCWGNNAIEYAPVVETADAYYYTAYFIDLETGFTCGRPFRQSKKWTVYGKLDEERKADVRFQIGATKAARNVILKVLPSWLIDKAMEECKAGVRKDLERLIEQHGLAKAQDLALKSLAKHGVKEEEVLAKFSVAARSALDVDRLVIIKGDLAALQRGDARAVELYPPPAPAAPTGGVSALEARVAAQAAAPEAKDRATIDKAEEEAAVSAWLTPEDIAQLREKAAAAGVAWSAVEEDFGGPVEDYSEFGKDRAALGAEVDKTIKRLAGRGAESEASTGSLFDDGAKGGKKPAKA